MVKKGIQGLIKDNLLDPNKDLNIIFLIDEQNYKSNGYYNLEESIYEELKCGIKNVTKNAIFPGIIKGNLRISLLFKESKTNYLIQAADLIAGQMRKNYLYYLLNEEQLRKNLAFINYQIFLP